MRASHIPQYLRKYKVGTIWFTYHTPRRMVALTGKKVSQIPFASDMRQGNITIGDGFKSSIFMDVKMVELVLDKSMQP